MAEHDLRTQQAELQALCGKQAPAEPPLDWARNLWNTQFMGIGTVQFHVDLLVWERLLNASPDLRGIIELGSGNGGLSLYLALQAYQRQMQFATFDHMITGAAATPLGKLLNLAAHCFAGDLFNGEHRTGHDVLRLLGTWGHPLILLCDDGNKPREFQTFAPELRPGDIIGAHDWDNEIGLGDVSALGNLVTPYFWQECEEMGSLTRFWRRV